MDEEKALITPETGLTAQQVQEHLEAGLGAGLPADSGRSEKEIILRHSLTFFNLVFIVLAVLLIVGKSTVMNMGFLGVVVTIRSSAFSRKFAPNGQWTSCPWWPGGL